MTNGLGVGAVVAHNGIKKLGCLATVRAPDFQELEYILPPDIEIRYSKLDDDELIRQRYRPFFIDFGAFS
jgi:hypothetical protein